MQSILDPRVAAPRIEEKWAPILEGIDNVEKRRWIAHNLQNQATFLENSSANGTLGHHFYGDAQFLGAKKLLTEGTLQADISNTHSVQGLPTQTLAIVRDVFERFTIDQLISMRSMSGPSAYIQTMGFKQTDDGELLDQNGAVTNTAGTAFKTVMDPDYADCPTECTASKGVDFDVVVSTVNAACKRLQGQFSVMAEQDAASQYSLSLGDEIRRFIGIQMAREIQAEVLAMLIAGVGTTVTFSSAIPGGSVYANLDPRVYARVLYEKIQDADNGIFKHADGRRGANWIAGDPDAINRLLKLEDFSIVSRDAVPRPVAGEGEISQHSNLFGVANERYKLYKYSFMQADTLLLGVKSDAADETGFVHATYIPLTDLGTFRDPAKACVTVGATTRYANKLLRPGMYAKVTIT